MEPEQDSEWILKGSGRILDLDMLGEFCMDSTWILLGFWVDSGSEDDGWILAEF